MIILDLVQHISTKLFKVKNEPMDKRTFLKTFALGSLSMPVTFPALEQLIDSVQHVAPEKLAMDEDFWLQIRAGYRLKPDYINLESGYYCFMPQEILEGFIHHVREVNYQNSYYLRTVQFPNKKRVTEQLAKLADCDPGELAITRNTTESLDTIIGGIPWQAGDEAVMALQDYGAMLNMFDLQHERYGMINKKISLPNHPKTDDEIVHLYERAITPKTKLLMVCHIVNITGQILPVKKIIDMAHQKGVEVMVDGAHAFAQFRFSIRDLNCDYYGASLHKWLSAPLGAGLLYVKKEKIPKIWPLFAEGKLDNEQDIRKLNHTGTHPVHTDLAILNALEYYKRLGPERKETRLKYLQHYWTSKLRYTSGVLINTPSDPVRHCAIGNVGVEGLEPSKLAELLLKEYRIWTVAINRPGVKGVRITPNIYTTTEELDSFVEAILEISKR